MSKINNIADILNKFVAFYARVCPDMPEICPGMPEICSGYARDHEIDK